MPGLVVETAVAPVRVVVADDAPEARSLIRLWLEAVEGIDVVGAAADGGQAVELVEGVRPDLVLLDVAMPVMDGLEAATEIRANWPDVKIAMYSAYGRERMEASALAAGADAYVEKAATIDELLEQIHALFPDRSIAAAADFTALAGPITATGVPLSSAEQRYRLLLDALEEGVLVVDAQGLVTDANFVATQILQTPVSRMLGQRLADLGIDGKELGIDSVEGAINSHRPVSNIDYVLTRPDGEDRALLVSVRPLHDPASLSMHETLVSFVDRTGQRDAEQRALAAEARLRETFDAMLEGLAIFSPIRDDGGRIVDFRYDYINDAGCRLNMMARDQLIGRRLGELPSAHRDSGLFDEYVHVSENRQPLEQRSMIYADGSDGGRRMIRAFDVHAVPSGDGFAVSWRDVTEEVRAQRALADSEARYRQMLETTQEGVWTLDADDRTSYVNPRTASLLGRTVDEMAGTSIWDYVSDGSRDVVEASLRARREGTATAYEVEYLRPDGTTVWALVTATPMSDAGGRHAGSLKMLTDVTERKQIERRLIRTLDLLERSQAISATGGWEFDLTTGKATWTDEVYRIYGLEPAAEPTDLPESIAAYDADSAPVIEAAFKRLITEGEPYDLQLGLVRADGEHRWVRTIGRPVYDGAQLVRAVGNIVDVTDRVRAESRLAENQRRLTDAFESLQEGLAIYTPVRDADGRITDFRCEYVNEAGVRLTGSTREALVDQLLGVVRPWQRKAGIIGIYAQVAETGEPVTLKAFEIPGVWTAGRPESRYFDIRAVASQGRVVATFNEVTEHVRTLEAVRASTGRLGDAVEAITDAFVLMSAVRSEDGAIVDLRYDVVNGEAARLLGRSPDDLLGRRLLEVFPQHEPLGLFDRYRDVVATGALYSDVVEYHDFGVDGTFEFTVSRAGDGCALVGRDISERLRTQEELRRSEQLFRGGFENSPIGMLLTNVDGTFARANAAFAQMLGYDDPDELSGVSLASVTHPDDVADSLHGIELALSGRPFRTQKRYLRRDGGIVHATLGSTAVTDADGRPIMFFTQVEDITDRLRAEQALAASERRLQDTFDALLEGLAVFSAVRDEHGRITDFRYIDINPAGCRLTGMPRDALVGRLLTEVRPWHRTSGTIDTYARAVETGEPFTLEAVPFTGEWEPGHRETRLTDISGVVSGDLLIATWRDVTAQLTAEVERRESEERLHSAVASLKDGFFLTRARRGADGSVSDLECVVVNDAGHRLVGAAPAEVIGRGLLEVWPGVTRRCFDAYRAVIETGVPFNGVIDSGHPTSDGTLEVSATRAGDGCVLIVSDVSDRVRHETELTRAHADAQSRAEQLERSNRDLEAFATALSHDLREPLRSTAGFARILEHQFAAELPEQGREFLRFIVDGTRRMNDRITAILEFARSGATSAPPHRVDSAAAAVAAAQDAAAAITAAGAELQIEALPPVQADALQLQRVFLNLITNATKYRCRDGTPKIRVSAELIDGECRCTVADNGPGVPESQRERIFAMFVRGRSDEEGTGMGLAMCRRIVESYGGRIWVEDNPSGGSLFRFTLPAASA